MPSFDIVSKTDMAELDNALNNTRKAILQRFDFRGAKYELNLDKKEKKLVMLAEDGTKLEAIREMFKQNAIRRNLSLKCFDFGEVTIAGGGMSKREIKIRDGLEQETAKQITKLIKESALKVQASIQGDEIRVTGKKIDDLQAVIATLNAADLEVALQYVNMKRD
ncbi:MAG: YajQ family cyclic di-GMP-binding protein [Planctomycetaceae bacterium]|jgi:uncharacterized protein YajQ (UPF0234 family)|nr:YajQ family cyclic di-GMP-binding protein [Phycisphaerales bacterium]MCE2652504.1 YajQ family cyclic di-GMP-binding protein [Planctomycetaceae bacterium]